ncbi:MAG TPA: oligosaccharide flippase family protein, partial [Dehalococcoidia bacterium]|nr:oligosaccharide flippase family protein [Dehalococcoidia bacterium]
MTPGAPTHSEPPGSGLSFLRVNLVLASNVATALVLFAINVVLFRELGAAGKGHYTLFVLVTTLASGFTNLGVGLANVYFVARGKYDLHDLLAGAQLLLAVVALATAAAVGGAYLLDLDAEVFGELPGWLLIASIPATLQLAYVAPLLQAQNRFVAYNIASFIPSAGAILGVLVLVSLDELSTGRALAVWVCATVAADVFGMTAIGWAYYRRAFPFIPKLSTLREQLRFGLQGEVGNLLQMVNFRLDQFVIVAFVDAAAVGIYSVAVAVSEGLWLLARATSVVLIPRLTATDDEEAADLAAFACRTLLLVAGLAAIAMAIVAPLVIEPIFGTDAEGAILPTLLLLPGVLGTSGLYVTSSYLLSRGKPLLNSYSLAATAALTGVLD